MAIGDPTEKRRTPEQQAAQDEAEAQVVEVLTDLPLQEVRELAWQSEPGTILTSSDGRQYRVNRARGLTRLWSPGERPEKAIAARIAANAKRADEKARPTPAQMQAERTIVMRVQNAVAKLAADGLSGEDFLVMRGEADELARAKPVDGDLLAAKMQSALDMVVSAILTGKVKFRSAAEAVSVGKTLAELLAFMKADAAAIATQAVIEASAMDSRTEYMQMLAELKMQTDAEKKKQPESE